MIYEKPVNAGQISDGLRKPSSSPKTPAAASSHGQHLDQRPEHFRRHRAINRTQNNEIWSDHPGGAYVVFCDASVHFLSQQIDTSVLFALCTRDQREIIRRRLVLIYRSYHHENRNRSAYCIIGACCISRHRHANLHCSPARRISRRAIHRRQRSERGLFRRRFCRFRERPRGAYAFAFNWDSNVTPSPTPADALFSIEGAIRPANRSANASQRFRHPAFHNYFVDTFTYGAETATPGFPNTWTLFLGTYGSSQVPGAIPTI